MNNIVIAPNVLETMANDPKKQLITKDDTGFLLRSQL